MNLLHVLAWAAENQHLPLDRQRQAQRLYQNHVQPWEELLSILAQSSGGQLPGARQERWLQSLNTKLVAWEDFLVEMNDRIGELEAVMLRTVEEPIRVSEETFTLAEAHVRITELEETVLALLAELEEEDNGDYDVTIDATPVRPSSLHLR
jgi:hypothetical protein